MTTDITIRKSTPADAPALAELTGQLGYPTTPDEARARLVALNESPDDALFVAADNTNRVVGWLHVVRRISLMKDPYAEILGLVVDEKCRHHGIGRRLIAEATTWSLNRNLAFLRVRTNVIRTGTQDYYTSLGFNKTKEQAVLDMPLNNFE